MGCKMIAVILSGEVINVGPWQHVLEDGTENPLPEGAVEGPFDIVQTSTGKYVLASSYAELRRTEYPPIGDQLDALFHAGVFPTEMAAMLQAVKDKYPKPKVLE